MKGNEVIAEAAIRCGCDGYFGYPITPQSEVMETLMAREPWDETGMVVLQAESEVASINMVYGAAGSGKKVMTSSSSPGVSLMAEGISYIAGAELPCLIVNVQRGGPSTGLPTKTEQADLLQAVYGRNGEAPVPVLAASTPSDCFNMAIEASRIAVKYMTPVILLTDGYIANGSEPWRVPNMNEIVDIPVKYREEVEGFAPYLRDDNLSRPWVKLGTPGLEHRIGGLEKANITGDVSYDPDNHNLMINLRDKKVKNVANDIPDLTVDGDQQGDLLVLGWGGTYGAITEAVHQSRRDGYKVSQAHLKYLNPMPKNTEEVLKNFKKVLIPEINLGQLAKIIRSEYLIRPEQLNIVRGLPFRVSDIEDKIIEILGGK